MIAGPINECERCGIQLLPGREVWLELSTITGRYDKPGNIHPERSQGLFPFGRVCAAKEVKS